jgi:N-carbamoylputrescine amidase
MRVTVCELDTDHPEGFEADWSRLGAHARAEGSQLVLLPEMPFAPWLAAELDFDAQAWNAAVTAHEDWLARLGELGGATALISRPLNLGGRRVNQAYAWDPNGGLTAGHEKYYLPDEEGFWEASWYGRGDGRFDLVQAAGLTAGFLICTELWFFERARAYGKAGAHLLAVPRATERQTVDQWLAAGRCAAVCAGAYCLSSNRVSAGSAAGGSAAGGMGGGGWIVDPDGAVVAVTTREQPFCTREIDPQRAQAAKGTYPRYVVE